MKAGFDLKGRAAGLAIALLGLMLAGCASVDEVAYQGLQKVSGPTGTPIPAFANLKPGSEEDFIMNAGRRVYFKAGSTALDGTAKATLDKQAIWLNQHPHWKIKLQGHADDPSSNGRLSSQRAEAVMKYLASRGVAQERMWSKGYAKKRPVQDCADITCKSQNRRVVSNLREKLEDHVVASRQGAVE